MLHGAVLFVLSWLTTLADHTACSKLRFGLLHMYHNQQAGFTLPVGMSRKVEL